MMRTVAIIQARMSSTRLPGKVMLPLAGSPVIDRVLRRLRRCRLLDVVHAAIPNGQAQQPLIDHLSAGGTTFTLGPEEDVLARTLAAAVDARADIVVRVTSDCPFVEPEVVDAVIAARRAGSFDYARTAMERGFPLGYDCEAFTLRSLEAAHREAKDPYEREHVTSFIWRRPERFSTVVLDHEPDRRHWRLVIDSEEDYRMAAAVYEALRGMSDTFGYADLQRLFSVRPDLLAINRGVRQTPYRR